MSKLAKQQDSGSGKSYFSKIVLPIFIGGIVTLVINFTIASYSEQVKREQQRTDKTLAFNVEILSKMNTVRASAKANLDSQRRLFDLLRPSTEANSNPVSEERISLAFDEFTANSSNYLEVFDTWDNDRLIYKSNTELVFGEQAARALDDRTERRLSATLDKCVVELFNVDEANDKLTESCSDRQKAQIAVLESVIDSATDGDFGEYNKLPTRSFSARTRIVEGALKRYSLCGSWAFGLSYPEARLDAPTEMPKHCADYASLTKLVDLYIGLLAIARERFADSLGSS